MHLKNYSWFCGFIVVFLSIRMFQKIIAIIIWYYKMEGGRNKAKERKKEARKKKENSPFNF